MATKATYASGETERAETTETTETPACGPQSGQSGERDYARVRRQAELIRGEIENLSNDNSGEKSMMKKGKEYAVGLMVVGLLAAFLIPIAIDEIVAVDTSSWGSAESSLWTILPIFIVLGIAMFLIDRN